MLVFKRQVFRQIFDEGEKSLMLEYVTENLLFTDNFRSGLYYIVEKEEISDNLFSISSLTNQYSVNREMIEQAYGWFSSIFQKVH
jgi:hypothetical protein